MSCRGLCRRTLRGCLRIPGCKTICYRCILPPFCSGDSDDEKEEKDDEGYDSYGITASQNPLPEPQPLISGSNNTARESNFENHDYINEPTVEDVSASLVDNKMSEAMYVSMNICDDDDKMASKSTVQYTMIQDTSKSSSHDYMNESVLFAKSDSACEQGYSNCPNDTDILGKGNSKGNDCSNGINGCSPAHRQKSELKVNNSSSIKDYETRSLESKVTDAVSKQQTLILLETDL